MKHNLRKISYVYISIVMLTNNKFLMEMPCISIRMLTNNIFFEEITLPCFSIGMLKNNVFLAKISGRFNQNVEENFF